MRSLRQPERPPGAGSNGIGKDAPWLTSLVLITSLEFVLLGRAAITDITLTFFITVALMSFFRAYSKQSSPPPNPPPVGGREGRGAYRLFYAALALAVLTKGPVGLVLPGGIIFLFLLSAGRLKETVREMRLVEGAAIFLVLAAPWYIAEFMANGKEYFDAFFVKHNFNRYAGVNSGHGGSLFYFVPVILLGFFPWSAFLPWTVGRVFRPSEIRSYRAGPRRAHLPLFAAIWFALVFFFFSLSGTKLPGYILPLFPAMAILVGLWWGEVFDAVRRPQEGETTSPLSGFKGMRLGSVLLGVIGALIIGPFLFSAEILSRVRIPETFHRDALGDIQSGLALMGGTLLIGIVLYYLALTWRSPRAAFGVLVTLMTVVVLGMVHKVLPAADSALQTPLREMTREAENRIANDRGTLVVYGIHRPSIIFYSRRHATVLRHGEEPRLQEILHREAPAYIITTRREIKRLPALRILRERGGYLLATEEGG
jgi:4-amino-4-deoxy-L-arabinose transferase-like glycosyltransferase